MRSGMANETSMEDPRMRLRLVLAALWISHFLLWTFGDMLSLLQEATEPVSDSLLLFVSVPLAILQTVMIVYSLVGQPRLVRWASIGLSLMFLVFNIGYLFDSSEGWSYLLGAAYILINALIIWHAWRWETRQEA